jgi:hypothetical protein
MRTLGAATRAAMEALITAAILSTMRRATDVGWVLEYRVRARVCPFNRSEAKRGFAGRNRLEFLLAEPD